MSANITCSSSCPVINKDVFPSSKQITRLSIYKLNQPRWWWFMDWQFSKVNCEQKLSRIYSVGEYWTLYINLVIAATFSYHQWLLTHFELQKKRSTLDKATTEFSWPQILHINYAHFQSESKLIIDFFKYTYKACLTSFLSLRCFTLKYPESQHQTRILCEMAPKISCLQTSPKLHKVFIRV